MSIQSVWNKLVQKNRDAVKMSAYEARVLTNNYEACHGDFAYLPDYYSKRTDEFVESTDGNYENRTIAFAR